MKNSIGRVETTHILYSINNLIHTNQLLIMNDVHAHTRTRAYVWMCKCVNWKNRRSYRKFAKFFITKYVRLILIWRLIIVRFNHFVQHHNWYFIHCMLWHFPFPVQFYFYKQLYIRVTVHNMNNWHFGKAFDLQCPIRYFWYSSVVRFFPFFSNHSISSTSRELCTTDDWHICMLNIIMTMSWTIW